MRFVDNDGVTLAVETRGRGGAALLFVHGWISSRRMWYDVIDRVDLGRFTAHAMDFRGVGASDRPREGHDLAGYAGDLRAVLASIDAPVTIVAHSMGGKVAQFVALDPPPNLQRLVLLAPGSARAFAMNPKHRALAEDAFGSRVRIERFQRAAMVRAVAPQTMVRITEDALFAQWEAWFGWYDRGRTADFSEHLGAIALPTAVMGADGDPLASPARLRRDVVEPIRGALFIGLRGVGHNLPVEAPDEVAELIARF